jgi:hypothetical protein
MRYLAGAICFRNKVHSEPLWVVLLSILEKYHNSLPGHMTFRYAADSRCATKFPLFFLVESGDLIGQRGGAVRPEDFAMCNRFCTWGRGVIG